MWPVGSWLPKSSWSSEGAVDLQRKDYGKLRLWGSNSGSSLHFNSRQSKERDWLPRLLYPLLIGLVAALATLATFLAYLVFISSPTTSSSASKDSSTIKTGFQHITSDIVRERLLSPIKWEPHTYSPCGGSATSARAAGCVFGPTTWAWYPPACYDWALEAEFLSAGNWTWHSLETLDEGSRLVKEDVIKGKHPVAYMSLEYHKMHCQFARRKLLRAVLSVGGALPDNYVLGMAHMEHCEEVEEEALLYVKGAAKYLDCIKL